jgi:hypothetical protein
MIANKLIRICVIFRKEREFSTEFSYYPGTVQDKGLLGYGLTEHCGTGVPVLLY